MKLRSRFLPAAAAAALVLAACDADEDVAEPGVEDTETGADTDGATADDAAADGAGDADADGPDDADAAGGAVELQVGDSDLGDHVVDGEGRTLYASTDDEDGVSNCVGDCAQVWQPLLANGEPTAGEGIDETLLGTTDREDGGIQVTYDGRPLYTFVADGDPGATRGQGIAGTWWVVGVDGAPLEEGGAQAPTTDGAGDADGADDADGAGDADDADEDA